MQLADHDRSPRLIVTQESGHTRVFELSNIGGSWYLSENFVSVQHDSTRGAFATFVLDKGGNELVADAQNLQVALTHQAALGTVESYDPAGAITTLWVTVNRTTLACYANLDGPRTALYEDEYAQFEKAVVVHAQGCAALVVQSRNCTLSMFSLPDLSYIARAKFDTTLQCVEFPLWHSPRLLLTIFNLQRLGRRLLPRTRCRLCAVPRRAAHPPRHAAGPVSASFPAARGRVRPVGRRAGTDERIAGSRVSARRLVWRQEGLHGRRD